MRYAAPLFLIAAATGATGCARTARPVKAPGVVASAEEFPQGWVGRYEGPLEITRPGEPMVVPMSVGIAPTDSPDRWHWQIQYQGQPARQYLLLREQDGSWTIDEQNSIVLPLTVRGSRAFSAFSIGGSLLIATYTRTAEGLDFEVTTLPLEAVSTTGGEGAVPPVGIYPLLGYQHGRLARVESAGR